MKVRLDVVETRGTYLYLPLLQVRGRMGYECLGEHRLRDVIDEFVGSLPRQFGFRVEAAKELYDYIPEQRAFC